jgi:hypothetical protein
MLRANPAAVCSRCNGAQDIRTGPNFWVTVQPPLCEAGPPFRRAPAVPYLWRHYEHAATTHSLNAAAKRLMMARAALNRLP